MIDHVGGGGRLAPPRGRLRTAGHAVLGSFDLEPRVPERFGEVVVNRPCDGHGVCHRLGLLVVLAEAPAEVFLHHGVAGGGGCRGEDTLAQSPGTALHSEPGFSPAFLASQHKARLLYIIIDLVANGTGRKMFKKSLKKK